MFSRSPASRRGAPSRRPPRRVCVPRFSFLLQLRELDLEVADAIFEGEAFHLIRLHLFFRRLLSGLILFQRPIVCLDLRLKADSLFVHYFRHDVLLLLFWPSGAGLATRRSW